MKKVAPLIIFLATFIIRTYKIEKGDFVVWDEAHFGKFASKYLSRSFYFDVHPPLGKLLTALGGYLFNQPIDFLFESASKYPSNFDYVGMRRFHSLISSLTPVFSYLILREINYTKTNSFLFSMMFIFENGFTSIGRLILLDSHLLTATSAVIYFLARCFKRNRDIDLFYLGISLGLVLSIKWIGCFTTALVGVYIIYCLMYSKDPLPAFIRTFCRYAFFLILVPVSIYIGIYYIHFKLVNKTSTDEGHMSSFFQATLEGNSHIKNRKYIGYGTKVTIKNMRSNGGYLHSHNHEYPSINSENTDQSINQITSYSHKDNNNNWAMQKVTETEKEALFVTNNEKVVIYHLETGKYLNVLQNEAYFDDGYLTAATSLPLTHENVFVIEIVDDTNIKEDRVKSLTTRFMLKHLSTGTYLKNSGKKYPDWGFQQGEIVSSKSKDEGSYWTIEENTSNKISEELNPFYNEVYKAIFIRNFIEHNILQYNINKSFIQDTNLEPEKIVSRPYEWLFLRRGLRMCNWDDSNIKFYMFGNPLLWYTSSICVFLSPIIYTIKYIRYRRGLQKFNRRHLEAFEVFISTGGWVLHYLPFFVVGRVLYFHHYYPALFFALLSVCYIFNHFSIGVIKFFVCWSVYFYIIYSPLTYGFVDPESVKNLKILESWDFIE